MTQVSVIIPAYNKAEYTRRTIESVLAQTYSSIEIVVVDDGSTDDTPQMMRQYEGRVKYLVKKNGGACSARNTGINFSTGRYIAFLDCDDLYTVDKIELCVDYLENHLSSGFVYSDADFINEQDDVVGRCHYSRSVCGRIAQELILFNFICNSTVVVRRDVLQEAGFFDETIFTPGDWDMWLRLAQITEAGYIAKPLTKYRITDNYIFNKLEQAYKEEQYVINKFFTSYNGVERLKKKAVSNFYMRFAQCFFLKNNTVEFWANCRLSLKEFPGNIKTWLMMSMAFLVPGYFKNEMERRILRRGKS